MQWIRTVADILVPGIGTKIVRLELAVLAVACLVAWIRPRSGTRVFDAMERRFRSLAQRRRLSALTVGAFVLVLRTVLLPVAPPPVPGYADEFSYLLAADTFLHGRLANPTHPMWIHFETFHVDQQPTYASMYPPVQGMVLAVGKIVAGRPWFGEWLAAAAMCSAITWMLQVWVGPEWALLGGLIAALRIATYSYWINTFFGGAAGALGGALVIGSLPRIATRAPRAFHSLLMVAGIGIILNSRPFEGAIVSASSCVALIGLLLRVPLQRSVLVRRIALPIGVAGAALIAAMAYYSWRVFGSPFTPPYALNRATYAVAPVFVFQSAGSEPAYHHEVMRRFYLGWELETFWHVRTLTGYLQSLVDKWKALEAFFLGPALLIPLLVFPASILSRRIRVPVLIAAAVGCALLTEIWVSPHYPSPITCVIYAVVVEAIRRLRAWEPGGRRSGLLLSRAVPVTCVLTVLIVGAGRLVGFNPVTISGLEFVSPYWGLRDRASVLARLERLPGKHLVVVRYSPDHSVHEEWVFNEADIDAAKVVWAREMDPTSDRSLLTYFSDRRVWLLEPDVNPPRLSDYSAVVPSAGAP